MNNRAEIVFRLAPDIYNENETMLAIYDVQASQLSDYEDKIYRIFLNNYARYADIEGIRRFEAIFYIVADEVNESLEYRRARIINKLGMFPPFTRIFLEQFFTNIFGEEMFVIRLNYDEYRIEINVQTEIEGLFEQTMKDVRNIILPANIILEKFIIRPYTHRFLNSYYTQRQLEELDYRELSKYA